MTPERALRRIRKNYNRNAQRYDRGIDDIFAVQDEITLTLATEMQVRLTEGEQARLRSRSQPPH